MYYLVGPQEILQTVIALAASRVNGAPDATSVRAGYFEFLRRTQPGVAGDRGRKFGISGYSEGDESLRVAFGYELSEPGWSALEGNWDVCLLRDAQSLMGRVDKILLQVFELVTLWVYSPSSPVRPGSGTLYQGNGMMYVNPAREWTLGDVCEAYLHELTHVLLSLDEHRYGHYGSYEQMAEEKYFAPTAILGRLKPLHLAFHSAVVATEVLALRGRLLELGEQSDLHRPTQELVRSSIGALRAIRDLVDGEPSLMTERGTTLLTLTEQRLGEHAVLGAA